MYPVYPLKLQVEAKPSRHIELTRFFGERSGLRGSGRPIVGRPCSLQAVQRTGRDHTEIQPGRSHLVTSFDH